MTETPAVFTPAEVAQMIGASENFVRQLAREHRVPHLRVGRSAIRFTTEQAEAVVTYLTQPPEAPTSEGLTTPRSRARRTA